MVLSALIQWDSRQEGAKTLQRAMEKKREREREEGKQENKRAEQMNKCFVLFFVF